MYKLVQEYIHTHAYIHSSNCIWIKILVGLCWNVIQKGVPSSLWLYFIIEIES